MNVLAWIIGLVLAALFTFAGITKLIDLDRQRERFGYSATQFRGIGACELAGAIGVVIGLVSTQFEWVAVAAGLGICVLMLGALLNHARLNDTTEAIPAAVVFVLSAIFIIAISIR